MIFERTNIADLEHMLAPYMGQPLWPGIDDPQVRQNAREHARQTGLWDRLAKTGCRRDALPTLRFSEFDNYARTGSREPHQSSLLKLSDAMDDAALALWLDHPSASIDWLMDLMWEWCGSDWSMPSHKGLHIELFGTRVGRNLCEYSWLFADRLHPDVRKRVANEIDSRMLNVALDWRKPDQWNTRLNNWNLVCNSDLVQMAMYQVHDSMQLATFAHTLCRRMDYAIGYFTPDGGCVEGPGYWDYGFSHFLNLAIAMKQRTGGAVDLTADPHVRAICRFPLAAQLRGPKCASFADGGDGYLNASTALKVNAMVAVPQLFRLVEPLSGHLLKLSDIRGYSLYRNEQYDPTPDTTDCHLPSLQYAKLHDQSGAVLAVTAGDNGVSHNHNDIGSYILMLGDLVVVTDPGLPLYNSQTFSPTRYEMLFCRSKGHGVPMINGLEQAEGSQYHGTLQVQGLNSSGPKQAIIDMTRAYPDPTLIELRRELELNGNALLRMTDIYRFSEMPSAIEEAFITFEPVALSTDRKAVVIGPAGTPVRLHCKQDGEFAVQAFTPEEHQGQDPRTVHRIAFHPAALRKSMELEFVFSLLK